MEAKVIYCFGLEVRLWGAVLATLSSVFQKNRAFGAVLTSLSPDFTASVSIQSLVGAVAISCLVGLFFDKALNRRDANAQTHGSMSRRRVDSVRRIGLEKVMTNLSKLHRSAGKPEKV